MYMVVEIKDGKIVWTDGKLSSSKREVDIRKEFIEKKLKKHCNIIKFTEFKLVS